MQIILLEDPLLSPSPSFVPALTASEFQGHDTQRVLFLSIGHWYNMSCFSPQKKKKN